MLGGAVPKFLIRHAETVEVGLKTSIDVPLDLHEHIVERAWVARTADTTAEWAIQARIRSLEQVIDLAQGDRTRMAREHEAARGPAKALDQSGMGERRQDLCNERCLQVANLCDLPCVELCRAIVVEFGEPAQHCNRALGVLSVHRAQSIR